MNPQELNKDQKNETTGGGLLGGGDDRNMLSGVTQGYVNLSQTDDDGDTESSNIDFGSGSLLESESDD